MPRQKKRKTNVIQMPVQQLMGCLHEQNPRVHSWEDDLPKLVKSLLFAGWCELPSFNQTNDRVIGGHGRIMACEWLIQQPKTWFLEQWDEYVLSNPDATDEDKQRFDAGYWLKVPVKVSDLDDSLHKAMMIRLNNAGIRGKSKDEMKSLILSRLNPAQQDIAIPDPERRSRLLQGVAAKQADRLPELQREAEARQVAVERVAEVMQDFTPRDDEPEAIDTQAERVDFESMSTSEIGDSRSAVPLIDPEAVVGEGGAHFQEDPKPNEKRGITYPLAVILSDRRWKQLEQWKQERGISSDLTALMKGHCVFKPEPEDEQQEAE